MECIYWGSLAGDIILFYVVRVIVVAVERGLHGVAGLFAI